MTLIKDRRKRIYKEGVVTVHFSFTQTETSSPNAKVQGTFYGSFS